MLHGNPTFRDTLLSRSDLDTLIFPLLERVYNAEHARAPASLYVVVIVLLTFSEDSGFNTTAFQHLEMTTVPWYQERYMKKVSLGSLYILVTLRLLVYNLSRLNDFYLLENTLAILSNISPHAEQLHPYACQRMLAVLLTVTKKYSAYYDKFTQAQAGGAEQQQQQNLEQMLHVYSRCVEVMLRAVNMCLHRKIIHKNATLIYVLLHKRKEVVKCLSHPVIGGRPWVGTVPALINFMNERIKAVEGDLSVSKTMEVIERGISAFIATLDSAGGAEAHVHRAQHDLAAAIEVDEPMKIGYQEQDESEAFFVPYTWEVIHAHTAADLSWQGPRVSVFSLPKERGGSEPNSLCAEVPKC